MYVADIITIFVLSFMVLIPIPKTNSLVYNSVAAMEVLIETQKGTIKYFEIALRKERKRLNIVENFLSRIVMEHEIGKNDIRYYQGNPLYRLNLLNRLYIFDDILMDVIIGRKTGFSKNKKYIYPKVEDICGARDGMVRLQEVYRLEVSDLANGTLKGHFSDENKTYFEYGNPMTADDCFLFGIASILKDSLPTKVEWLKEALVRYRKDPFHIISQNQIMQLIADYYFQMNDTMNHIEWAMKAKALTFEDTVNKEWAHHYFRKIQVIDRKCVTSENFQQNRTGRERWKVEGCYEDTQVVWRPSHSCMLTTDFQEIFAMKAEILHDSPDVLLIHDFLLDSEQHNLITLARRNGMDTSIVTTAKGDKNYKSHYREAQEVRLYWTEPLIAKIRRRIALFTSQKNTKAFSMQVLNYGIGGYFGEHIDPYEGTKRATTIILFLSNVTQGGAMVFREIGLKVYPTRGAALIFEGLYPSGHVNMHLAHSACPVLRGSKWIMLYWVLERDYSDCPVWYYENENMKEENV